MNYPSDDPRPPTAVPRPSWRSFLTRANVISAIPVVAAILLSGFISFSYNTLIKRYRNDVDHTFLVLAKIDATFLQIQDAETGQRGYIITGDDRYLAPFREAEANAGASISDLAGLIVDNPAQVTRLAEVRRLVDEKFDELRRTIETRRRDGFDAARAAVSNNNGKETMDRIRALNAQMRDQERMLLEERLRNARLVEGLIVLVAVIGVTLSLIGRFVSAIVRARVSAK